MREISAIFFASFVLQELEVTVFLSSLCFPELTTKHVFVDKPSDASRFSDFEFPVWATPLFYQTSQTWSIMPTLSNSTLTSVLVSEWKTAVWHWSQSHERCVCIRCAGEASLWTHSNFGSVFQLRKFSHLQSTKRFLGDELIPAAVKQMLPLAGSEADWFIGRAEELLSEDPMLRPKLCTFQNDPIFQWVDSTDFLKIKIK